MKKEVRTNVFSPTFGNKPQQLLGRDALMKQLKEGLETPPGSRERVVIMTGQRGEGKTVLLLELADEARERGFVVASPTVVSPDMPEVILDKLQADAMRSGGKDGKKVTGASVGAFGFSAGIQFDREEWKAGTFSVKLDLLCEALNREGHGVLLLVDEVQANSAEMKQLAITYQELVGVGRDVAIVMAGLPAALSALLNDKVLTFLNRASKIALEPLRIGEIAGYFSRVFRAQNIAVSDRLCEKAAERTKGSPYMMQLVGYYMTKAAQADGAVTEEALENALRFAENDFQNDICETVLRSLSENDVRFLKAAAKAGETAAMSDIIETMNVSGQLAQQYRRRLLDAGVLESVRRGEVRFAVPYLREYLVKH